MTDSKSNMALDHEEGSVGAPLHGTVQFTEYVTARGEIYHLCRDVDGDLILMVDDNDVAMGLTEDVVRWLASNFLGALDNWPVKG